MKKNQIEEFDELAESYNSMVNEQTFFFDDDVDYFASYKVALTKKFSEKEPETILDYGCGIGNNIKHLCASFPQSKIYGYDISTVSIEIAAKNNPEIIFRSDVDSIDTKFDLIFVATVFHHIPRLEQQKNMDKIFSLAKNGAKLFIFEHNPFNLVTRYIFKHCPIDKNAEMIKASSIKNMMINANFKDVKIFYTLFFPKQLNIFRPLEKFLYSIPLGGQYLVIGVKK